MKLTYLLAGIMDTGIIDAGKIDAGKIVIRKFGIRQCGNIIDKIWKDVRSKDDAPHGVRKGLEHAPHIGSWHTYSIDHVLYYRIPDVWLIGIWRPYFISGSTHHRIYQHDERTGRNYILGSYADQSGGVSYYDYGNNQGCPGSKSRSSEIRWKCNDNAPNGRVVSYKEWAPCEYQFEVEIDCRCRYSLLE